MRLPFLFHSGLPVLLGKEVQELAQKNDVLQSQIFILSPGSVIYYLDLTNYLAHWQIFTGHLLGDKHCSAC